MCSSEAGLYWYSCHRLRGFQPWCGTASVGCAVSEDESFRAGIWIRLSYCSLELLTRAGGECKGAFEQPNHLFREGFDCAAISKNIFTSKERDGLLFHSSNHLAKWDLLHRHLSRGDIHLRSKTQNMGAFNTGPLLQLCQLVCRIRTYQRVVGFCNLDDSHFLHISAAHAIET